MPVGSVAAPPGGRVRAAGVGREAKQEIGERVAGAGSRRRVLRHDAREAERSIVGTCVGEQDVAAVHSSAELQNVRPFDPRDVVGDLVLAAVLPFRPTVVRVTVEARVPRERERRYRRDRGILNHFEAADAGLPQQVGALTLEVRRRSIFTVHVAESQLVNQ